MGDLGEYRERSLATWQRIAGDWAAEREFLWKVTEPVSRRLVELLDLRAGDTVMEIAGGTGDTGILAARSIGPGGKLIETDFSSEMVAHAQKAAQGQGIGSAEFKVLDAEDMDLPGDSIDKVVCRWGYMLMADPVRALRETRRVLKDGGRVAFAVWAAPEENVWASLPGRELVERGLVDPPQPGDPGIFGMADPARISTVLDEAGFATHEVDQVAFSWDYASPQEHWDLTLRLAGPLADALGKLPDEEREEIRSSVGERIGAMLTSQGGIPALTHVVTAS